MSTTYQAIYAFGDSLSDAGDAWLFTNSAYAAALGDGPEPVSPPYFQQIYAGGTTANVFSNGPVWVQDLARADGLGTLAPGSIGTDAITLLSLLTLQLGATQAAAIVDGLEFAQHTTGADPYLTLVKGAAGGTDFAIGGSVTGLTAENTGFSGFTDLAAQLANFHAAVPEPVAGALYTVWSGSNDLLDLLEDPAFATDSPATIRADVAASVANEVAMVESLVAGGARNVLVLNVPDLGKIPAITQGALAADSVAVSALGAEFDQLLATTLQDTNFGTARVSLENTYALIDGAVADPAAYGLTNVTDPVYTGSFTTDNGTIVSTNPAVQDQYLFFDHMHPTATGQAFVAQEAEALVGVPCFASGTAIATETGDLPVEALLPGERVRLARGEFAAVRWVGHRLLRCDRHPRPHDVYPVRVRANAFAAGQPGRDLLLSPDHAVFVDGVLIPVRYLLNGATIVQERVSAVTYFHIELERHDVLLAEGLPVESFLDTGNRSAFVSGGTALDLHPDFSRAVWAASGCAELVLEGAPVAVVRRRLLARAGRLGHTRTRQPALCVMAGGRRLTAVSDGANWGVPLPRGLTQVRLVSRVFAPAEMEPTSSDTRRLGVAIGGLMLDRLPVRLDGDALTAGWHAPEEGWRWTGGDAVVRVAGAGELAFAVVMGGPYWRRQPVPGDAGQRAA